jgi:23S rRNA (pseudouridine1915-N3)-methyltransferase
MLLSFILSLYTFMLSLHIIAIGTHKESYFKDAEAEYLKRLSPFAKIKITEIKEHSFRTDEPREKSQEIEAEQILKYIEAGASTSYIIALDEKGKQKDSVALARHLEEVTQNGTPIICIIGGPRGLSPAIIKKAHLVFSLSSLTFPHQLVRVILAEQLYRATAIMTHKIYHY